MSRKSLRPHLNQIRTWVRQGRTDAWVAHQLEVTVQQIQAFKREQELEPGGAEEVSEEVDLRASDDAAIAAALDEEERKRAEEEAKAAEEAARRAAEAEESEAEEGATDEDAPKPRTRARGGRARGRGRGAGKGTFEATFDHGEEGYGLWLDPDVADDATYAEHWAGHRPVEVTIEEDQIVIRRAGAGAAD
jgi:hypothetical protein